MEGNEHVNVNWRLIKQKVPTPTHTHTVKIIQVKHGLFSHELYFFFCVSLFCGRQQCHTYTWSENFYLLLKESTWTQSRPTMWFSLHRLVQLCRNCVYMMLTGAENPPSKLLSKQCVTLHEWRRYHSVFVLLSMQLFWTNFSVCVCPLFSVSQSVSNIVLVQKRWTETCRTAVCGCHLVFTHSQ